MTYILTQIKIKKILSTSTVAGISLMLFASIFSAIPTSNASEDPCVTVFFASVWDSKFVFDSDTGDFIDVYKCYIPDVDCLDNDPNENGVEEVPKKSDQSSTCIGFAVIMLTNVPDATLTDSLPAEWNALDFVDFSGSCTEEVKGKNAQGATVYTCDAIVNGGIAPYWAAFIVDPIETRASPSNDKNPNHDKPDKYKPTSCEPLFKNDGAEGFVPDDTFMNGNLNGVSIVATVTPFSTGLTDKIEVTVDGCIE